MKPQGYSKARDALDNAFAGNENRGPARHQKSGAQHGTKTKERKLDDSGVVKKSGEKSKGGKPHGR